MVTTYTPGTPVPTDPPASDVVNMQNNSTAINEWVQVDHVGFNTGAQGQHNQVTFQTNQSVPSLANGAVANEYVNSVAGIFGTMSSLFFNNGTKNIGLFNLPLTSSGTNYGITTPWGLIINFGFGTTPGSGFGTYTFAIAMNNNQFCVQATADSTSITTVNVNNVGATTFQTQSNPGSRGFYYLAIGS